VVLHNIKSIKTEDDLKKYALLVKNYLNLKETNNPLQMKQISDGAHKDKVIEHYFMGDKDVLYRPFKTQLDTIRGNISNMNGKQQDIKKEFMNSIKTVLYKYYDFDNNTNPLKWNSTDPLYKLCCEDKSISKRQEDRSASVWEPITVKTNFGKPFETDDGFWKMDIEIECAGLLVDGKDYYNYRVDKYKANSPKSDKMDKTDKNDKEEKKSSRKDTDLDLKDKDSTYDGKYDLKVSVMDKHTISINGYKKQMDFNKDNFKYEQVSHIIKIKETILTMTKNKEDTRKSFKFTEYGTIIGFTYINPE